MTRQLPVDLDAEASVIGCALVDNTAGYAAMGLVSPDDFFTQAHQILWRTITEMLRLGKHTEFLTLSSLLTDRGLINDVGGVAAIGNIVNNASGPAAMESHANRVRDMAMRRRVVAFADSLKEAAYSTKGDELAASAGQSLQSLLAHSTGQSLRVSEGADKVAKAMKLARERTEAGGVIGVSTTVPALDHITGGLYGPRLVVLAARPGSGKSALLNQIGFQGALRGNAGLICSIEMGAEELIMRAMASASKQNVSKIMRGLEVESRKGQDALTTYGDIPLWIDAETNKLDSICAQITMHKHRYGIKWAAVDHIGLVATEKFNSRNDQIGHITWTLKQLAKRLDIPIVALCQLSRKGETENRRPSLHDLRDSGNVEQDADIAIFLHTDNAERGKLQKPLHIGVLKNRCGPCAWLDSSFEFDGTTQIITEIAHGLPEPKVAPRNRFETQDDRRAA